MVCLFTKSSSSWRGNVICVVAMVLLLMPLASCDRNLDPIFWTAIHVSGDRQSGDANLLRMPSGKTILIDTGFERYASSNLIPALEERGVSEIDALLITHAHRNHYGAIPKLLERFKIHRVVFTEPPEIACRRERWAMGCDLQHVSETLEKLAKQTKIELPSSNQIVYQESRISIRALVLGDELNNPSVNDASTLFRLDYLNSSVLFTGDISEQSAEQALLKNHVDSIQAQAMTAPHHGVSATVSDAFYEAVNPDIVVVGVSKQAWQSERGKRTREYLASKATSTYVTGIHGNQDFTITGTDIHAQ